jgi:hypothetical protein
VLPKSGEEGKTLVLPNTRDDGMKTLVSVVINFSTDLGEGWYQRDLPQETGQLLNIRVQVPGTLEQEMACLTSHNIL